MANGFKATSRLQKRRIRLSHFIPYEEFLVVSDPANPVGTTGTEAGKPVKLVGSKVDLCADGDEIFGFLDSVEGGLHDAIDATQPCVVRCEGRVHALDLAGTLSIGDFVVATAQVPIGGAHPTPTVTGDNPAGRVKVAPAAADIDFKWLVVEVYDSGVDRPVLLQRV